MKETITDYKTIEESREVVYCDKCSSECTDDHYHEPIHVCPSCAKKGESYRDIGALRGKMREWDYKHDDELLGVFMFSAVAYPITVLCAFFDGLDGHDYAFWFVSGAIGTILWVVLPLLIFLGVLS